MTWEQFEETGAVEDYLSYRESTGRIRTRAQRREPESLTARKEMEHGTDNHSDRHGTGGISVMITISG